MEHDTACVTLAVLIEDYLKKRDLPYYVVHEAGPVTMSAIKPRGGIKGCGQNDWLGWIYGTDFKTYNWSMNKDTGIVKHISASDPDFFSKLEEWLPQCVVLWQNEESTRSEFFGHKL